jgi:FkbM family methyltransferase
MGIIGMIHSALGTLEMVNGKECISIPQTQAGFALYGPYQTFDRGRYSVTYKMMIPSDTRDQCRDDTICCVVDVTTNFGNTVLASRNIVAHFLKTDDASITLDFALEDRQELEFRAYATGETPLVIEVDRPTASEPSDSANPFFPILKNIDDPHDEFFVKNFDQIRNLIYNCGADVLPTASGTLINFFNIRFRIENLEDFQLVHEIFHLNAYNFSTNRDVCVIDIGMNVGLASLYFARMKNVRTVYSFEPFPAPFARALKNLDLNPDIREKIKPHNYGLSDITQELSVRCSEDATISTSIRGKDAGEEITIRVRDVAEAVSEILLEAKAGGLDLIVKMDCEGSEFPILERLDSCGLMKHARIFMIEWHKWWSPGKTQDEIIGRLMSNGFDVFDHTNPFDPYAGQLYAIRSAG